MAGLPKPQIVIAFVHQPSLGSVVNERGIPQAVRLAAARHEGEMWLVCGHSHANRTTAYQLPKTTIVQASITTCNGKIWGGSEKPGYWIYCIGGGRLRGRIYRRLGKGYRIDSPPNRSKARPIPEPFAGINQILWQVMVGHGDREYLVSQKAADVVTWWGYTKELVYGFPLAQISPAPPHLAILANLYQGSPTPAKRAAVFISPDLTGWQEMPLAEPRGGATLFALPPTVLQADKLYVKISGPGYGGGVAVAGFALCREEKQP